MTACSRGGEKEELRQLEGLEEINVTELAEDDEDLIKVFETKVHQKKVHQSSFLF